MNLSFQEKSIWVSLIIMLIVWFNYFSVIQPAMLEGNIGRAETIGVFIGAVIALIVLQIIGQIIIAVANPKSADQPSDERDKAIARRSGNISGWVLSFLVVSIGGYAMFLDVSSILIANLLLLAVVLTQCVDYAFQLLFYRRF